MAVSAKIEETPLMNILRDEIVRQGSISIADYMTLCLSHPQHGYYMTRAPFGQHGDFITAPEISQMFGEITGAYMAQQWQALGKPSPCHIIECGPGRGTLMKDALRVLQRVPGLKEGLQIGLVEISPALRKIQEITLQNFFVTWHDNFNSVPPGIFALVANEFLDALPLRQCQYFKRQWRERCIGYRNGALTFVLGEAVKLNIAAEEGDVFECSPARENFVKQVCARLKCDKGFALLIDYGAEKSGFGDTLQAVRNHKFTNVLENPGACDLTSHVDFGALMKTARAEGCKPVLMTQGEFLTLHGITERAQNLKRKNPDANIDADLQRLTAPEQMGKLFKVMTITA
jgi:SAM-dependent MidA family methyltransferase